ncbi:formylglycine-generating enzyme-like [Symsagittifera roscoffensis]|uniref:formylglycine-generating enzyme-like n=1 Tax=Symsagittifera roscoffensis TaxID=84072 RepID=UPI00307BC115
MSVLTELAAFHFLSLILFFLNLYGHLCVAELPENRKSEDSMVLVKGGVTEVGLEKPIIPQDGEGPIRKIDVPSFYIDKTEVTNAQFKRFVDATGYKTEAEKFGNSFVMQSFVSEEINSKITQSVASAPWWLPVDKADWQHPEGPDSSIKSRMDNPVVHVTWNDATEFCRWAGKRLPFEAEWERACNNGRPTRLFPWGNREKDKDGEWLLNIWQGKFPEENLAEDGHVGLAPVASYSSCHLGLHDMVGNVWEWTQDWHSVDHPKKPTITGPASGKDKVKKGGSFMCQKGFCYRYRCAARGNNSPDTSAYNLGFRCVKSEVPHPETDPTDSSTSANKHKTEL